MEYLTSKPLIARLYTVSTTHELCFNNWTLVGTGDCFLHGFATGEPVTSDLCGTDRSL